MRGLRDKVVLVTGAGGVIGRAISTRFVEEGAKVGVFDIAEGAARETVEACKSLGGRASAHVVDITDYDAVEAAVESLESSTGPVDVLVNNAGWDRFGNFVDSEPGDWTKLIAVNLVGPLNMHHVVARKMVEHGRGRIVNVSSDAARVGSSGEAVYSACKGGVVAFSKTLARELARQKINVNVVCPGPTDTPLLRSFVGEGEAGEKVYKALERAIPFKRLGSGDDLPGAVVFFASDDAAFITGQVLSVSGGLTMAG